MLQEACVFGYSQIYCFFVTTEMSCENFKKIVVRYLIDEICKNILNK